VGDAGYLKISKNEYLHIASAKEHDANAMDFIKYEVNNFYIFDRADNDFLRLFKIACTHFFVIRAKSNLKFKRINSAKVDKSKKGNGRPNRLQRC